jgi:Tfp pilus assembly protein PilF
VFYLVIYQIFGLSEPGFHLLNLLFHAMNAILVFVLGQKMGFQKKWSWSAALLWSLLPLHTEAVTYMSATADPSYSMFCLLAAIALVPSFSGSRILLASVFFLLGLMCKETAIVFPALALACLWVFPGKRTQKRIYAQMLLFWAIAIGYLISRKTYLDFDQTFSFYQQSNIYTENVLYRIYTFLATLPSYFRVIVWPDVLSMDRPFPVYIEWTTNAVMLGTLMLAVALAQLAWGRGQRGVALSWGILWFLAAHSPHMGILIPVNSLFLEHWMYLPSVGIFLGLAQSLAGLSDGKKLHTRIFVMLTAVVAVAWGVRTYMQNQIWESPIAFYEHILKVNPNSERVHNNLGMAYSNFNSGKAIEHYLKAIEISDSYAQTRHNLALVYLNSGNLQAGIEQLQKAISINRNFYQSYEILSLVYEKLGDAEKSAEYARRGIEIRRQFEVQ